ncbi:MULTISPECIES: MFS transporter [unclassified Modicisalibacter]|uniref:MFS transporter n=1 Tax=unclassified Modicisalibacter TaxID=2679913 RepID=UPI001CCC4030|nr:MULTISPECIES: MFS transporter [unclassified Modicisalibacter]MBZ9559007.1 MFS transporter [Modicisalibacter sp. R2A 31.J]MBZ9576881.1 MFS transporter [Modicisalibacter sp. MOD 31.J]
MPRLDATRLAVALCLITTAVNLQAPLYALLADKDGVGTGASSVAFACYVLGVFPVLLMLNGLVDRIGRKGMIVGALCLTLAATALTIVAPGLVSLGIARLMMGLGTAMMASVAPGWMVDLLQRGDRRQAANWVAASTSLGFGLGAAITSLFLLHRVELVPSSLWLYLPAASLALLLVSGLEDRHARRRGGGGMLKLPSWPSGSLPFALAILLAWATVGLVIALLPSALEKHGLAEWSGFATFGICSCGVLFQPWARRLSPRGATRLGLAILPPAFGLIAWGATEGVMSAILIGTLAASSACYGFIYLGGMSGVLELAGEQTERASAGFFLMAYTGFSLPVVLIGMVADLWGHTLALGLFGLALFAGALLVGRRLSGERVKTLSPNS